MGVSRRDNVGACLEEAGTSVPAPPAADSLRLIDTGRRSLAERRGMRFLIKLLLLGTLGLLLFACEQRPVAVTRLVEVTRLVNPPANTSGDGAIATRLVVVTATPPATGEQTAPAFAAEDPTHFRAYVESGPRTLDPAQAADAASRHLVQNVVEPLLLASPWEAEPFLPLLATSWLSSEEGLTYTFFIRPAVSFSNGNTLTAEDVAYTLQRGILQSTPDTPFSLLVDPLLGFPSGDVTARIAGGAYAGDREALLANASEQELRAVCAEVKEAIRADETAGTVTLSLTKPWAPLLSTLSQPWTGIIDRQWASARGAWDGSCENWAAWYAPPSGESVLATTILGTGPYLLDHWTPGVEFVLTSNEAYWRQTPVPLGPPGRVGAPPIKTISVYQEEEAALRWQALRTGNAETADLSPATQLLARQWVGVICSWPDGQCRPSDNEGSPLRHHRGLLLPERSALFFNFDIRSEGSPFIGSGQLDGAGVPPDFFGDRHVRQGFAACLDEARLIERALHGAGRPAGSLFPDYYAEISALPATGTYDPAACVEELAAAWDNRLPEIGFRIQLPIESGDIVQQQVALLLQEALREANDKYTLEIVGLSTPAYREALAAGQLPLAVLRWQAYLPDPHSWVAPAFAEKVMAFQRLPSDLAARFATLLEQGATTLATGERMAIYRTLEIERRENLPHILLPAATGDRYEQRWVQSWLHYPSFSEPYYYAYTLSGD